MTNAREIVTPNPKKELLEYWSKFTKKAAIGISEAEMLTGYKRTMIASAVRRNEIRAATPGYGKNKKYSIRLDHLAEWYLGKNKEM